MSNTKYKGDIQNMSMIKKDMSISNILENDDSFSLDILNRYAETDTSTHNVNSKLTDMQQMKRNLRIGNSLDSEEEEEESEDEKIEQNVMEIWNE